MKDEIKEILECIKDKKRDYVGTNGCLYQDLDRKELNLLLDYITNLQEENERWVYKYQHDLTDKQWEIEDYKSRCEKAIENIDLVIELIKQQPTEDDSWILNKLNGFKYLLNGGDDNE